jgi:pyocin large subunit-like protein
MSRPLIRLILLVVVLGVSWFLGQQNGAPPAASTSPVAESHEKGRALSVRQTWGRPETLPDHFARHGSDFHARDADDYAAQANAFLQRAEAAGLPAKRDRDGSLRIYERATGTFGAYNADGTAKTFFKPGSDSYFERQPGEPVDLRAAR